MDMHTVDAPLYKMKERTRVATPSKTVKMDPIISNIPNK